MGKKMKIVLRNQKGRECNIMPMNDSMLEVVPMFIQTCMVPYP